ncbi:MAG: DUF423 domain-containing protein [Caldithrix sp.]|nr:MAG: DUF423 domain-containing protein [Caldithrix sp.]TDI98012.1 MAG: DUF423 domain-containing protein [Caldithrix sp.]
MERIFFLSGAISAFLGVTLGAFAAHGLKTRLSTEMFNIFEVGVRYHMYHALALLAVAWACGRWPGSLTNLSGWLFIIGTVIFSGSLYVLSLTGVRWLGAITPLGGVAFLGGWACLVWAIVKN